MQRLDDARKSGVSRRPTRSGRKLIAVAGAGLLAGVFAWGAASRAAEQHADHSKLPPGPIRDRAELMEGVGKNAKAIGAAMKAGKPGEVAQPAAAIASVMDRYITLFPAGSEGHGSRAKPAVWTDRKQFDELAMQLKTTTTALATTAKDNGDVKAASGEVWKTCKACHDKFREPVEGE